MTTPEPTPEAVDLARELDDALDIGSYAMGDGPSSLDYARAFLAAGYVPFAKYAEVRDSEVDLSMALGKAMAENERLRAQVARAGALADEWGRTPENVKCYGLDRAHGERLRSVLDKTCSCTNDFGVLGADCGGTYCS